MRRVLALGIAVTLLVLGLTPSAQADVPFEGTDKGVAEDHPFVRPVPKQRGGGQVGTEAVTEPGPGAPSNLYVRPVQAAATISDVFNIPRYNKQTGQRRVHQGVDFADAQGNPIYAATSGTVVDKYTNPSDPNAYYTYLEVNNGLYSLRQIYAHWDSAYPAKGDSVSQGALTATIGTGLGNFSPHLHFESRNSSGYAVSPAPYFPDSIYADHQLEWIAHTPIQTATEGTPIEVRFRSGRPDQVEAAYVYYRIPGLGYTPVTMSKVTADEWSGTIPGGEVTLADLEYYIKVERRWWSGANET